MLVSRLLVGNNLGIVSVDSVVIDPTRTVVIQFSTRSKARLDLKVDQQLDRSGWRRAWRLPHGRDLAAYVGNGVLTGNVLAVFQHLGALVVNLIGIVAVVVNQRNVGQWLSQLTWIRQAHLNASMYFIAINIGLVVNRLAAFDPMLIRRLRVRLDIWRVGWHGVVVDPTRTAVGQLGT